MDGARVFERQLEIQQHSWREHQIVGDREYGQPGVDLEEAGLGLGEYRGAEPWPCVAARGIGVHTD